jgi:DNA-binding FadR family transcriptional regulator
MLESKGPLAIISSSHGAKNVAVRPVRGQRDDRCVLRGLAVEIGNDEVSGFAYVTRQDRIAAEFGVSHIPVREALKQLVAEGLAVFIKNCGIVVSELSPKVAWELTEYRCLIEGQMARWAVPMMTDRGSENTAAEHGISR